MEELHLLLVEDDPGDEALLRATLSRAGLGLSVTCVATAEEYRAGLAERPHLIICDFNLPQFDALTALDLRSELAPDIPLLVVTGAVGEESAAECIKRGAADFILKDHIERLPREVTRALEEASVRRNLREVEAEYRSLVESVPAAVYTAEFGPAGEWFYVSPQVETILGFSPEQLREERPLWDQRVYPDDQQRVKAAESDALETGRYNVEYRMMRADGAIIWIHDEATLVDGARRFFHGVVSDITERKRTEEALRAAEEHYRTLVETVTAVVWRADLRNGELTYVSAQAEQLLGYPISQWTDEPAFWDTHIHPEDRDEVIARAREAKATGVSHSSEYRMLHADGRVVWVRDAVRVVADESEVTEFVGVMVDVTEIKEAEREVRVRADQQAAVVELGQLALRGFSVQMLLDEAVRMVSATLATDRAAVLRVVDDCLVLEAVVGARLREDLKIPLGKSSQAGYTLMVDAPVISENIPEDQRFRWFAVDDQAPSASGMSVIIRDEERVFGVLATHTNEPRSFSQDDVNFLQAIANVLSSTIRRQKSQEQIAMQAKMLDQVGTGIAVTDSGGAIRYWNQAATQMLGWEADEVVGTSMVDLLVSDDQLDPAREHLDRLQQVGASEGEWCLRKKDGGSLPVFATATSVPIEGGGSEVIGVFVDISERKEMERRLRASEDQFRTAFMNMTAGMMICDEEGRYLAVNDAFCHMVGYERDELLGRSYRDITHPDDLPNNIEFFSALLRKGGTSDLVKRYVRKDGEIVWAEVTDIVLRDDEDGTFHALVQVFDITERKRAEEEQQRLEKQLLQSQKMEAVGRLAGGIAHDFNNLLAVIINYASFLDEDLPADDPRKEDVAEIKKAGDRATALVRQLLTFSRKEAAERSSLDLNDVVTDLRSLLVTSIGEDIEVDIRLEEGLPPVLSDQSQMEQILMNLVVNARDAMPQGGSIRISTLQLDLEEEEAAPLDLKSGRYVALKVADTGSGISPEVIDQIFEPFFSTKARDKGTGLGLATVYGLVTQANGSISVDSEPDRGTEFTILLPALVQAMEGGSVANGRGLSESRQRILVVDDEATFREMIAGILEGIGYEVTLVSSAEEALDVCSHGSSVDVVLADVVMPKMTGVELVRRLSDLYPRLPVVLMTGYQADELSSVEGARGCRFLAKPFKTADLLLTLAEVAPRG